MEEYQCCQLKLLPVFEAIVFVFYWINADDSSRLYGSIPNETSERAGYSCCRGKQKILGLKICVYFLSRVTDHGWWYCHFSVYQSDLVESDCGTFCGHLPGNRTVLSCHHIFFDITDFKNKNASSFPSVPWQ